MTKKQLDLLQACILSAYCTNFLFEELTRSGVKAVKHKLKNRLKSTSKDLIEFEKVFFDRIEEMRPDFEEYHHKITSNYFEFLEMVIQDGNKDMVQRMQIIFAHKLKPTDLENLATKIILNHGQ